ncbi:MAG: PAS domain-containing protein [Terracidiphilus sp.]|jgi:PAS domain S-box-containing protein
MKVNSRAASTRAVRKPTLNPGRRPKLNIDHLPLPYVEMDAQGIIARANRAALALHHPEQGDLIGSSGWDMLTINEKDRSSAAFLSLMATGQEPPVVCRSIFDRSGRFRTYEIYRSMIRRPGGRPAGMRMIFMDVTERKNALEEAQRACQWLESALGSVADAIVLTDVLGLVLSANPAAEALLGFTVRELEGKVIEEAVPILEYRSLDGAALDRRAAIENRCKGIATLLVRNGSKLKVEISTSPILDKNNGSVSGVAAILRRVESFG